MVEFCFLQDTPEKDDKFSSGGHKRAAIALETAIKRLPADKNHSIGLKGGWGSGKSTVINIAEDSLKESHAFFTFDVWQNQNLNFRRAFLEALLQWGKVNPPAKNYDDIENCVKGKSKIVTSKTEKSYSVFAYFFMATLCLWPFLYAFKGIWPASSYTHIYAYILIIAAFIIPLAALYQIGYYRYGRSIPWRSAFNKTFSLMDRKSETDTVTQSIREGDPTQYEFQEIFSQLLVLVSDNKKLPIIIIFDNIDRIPLSQIQEIWSEIRAVLAQDCSTKFTAIIPYDKKHILNAFKQSNTHSEQDSADNNSGESAETYEQADILRKIFDVTITVAAPVTAALKDFFGECLRETNLQLKDTEKDNIFYIFDAYLTEIKLNPTPRQVKSFINEFGALWIQWHDKIKAETIAIFIVHREELESRPASLQKPQFIASQYRHFGNSDNLDKELAALAYNVDPEIAYEILLGRDISSALSAGTADKLEILRQSPGFETQFGAVINQVLPQDITNERYNSCFANYGTIRDKLTEALRESCDKYFLKAIEHPVIRVSPDEWAADTHLFQLIRLMPKEKIKLYITKISEIISLGLSKESPVESGQNWIETISGFLEETEALYGHDFMLECTKNAVPKLPGAKNFYIGLAIGCAEANLSFKIFDNGGLSFAYHEELAALALKPDEDFIVVWPELTYLIEKQYKSINWVRSFIIGKLGEALRNNNLGDNSRLNLLKKLSFMLSESSKDDDITKALQPLINSNKLGQYLNAAEEEEVAYIMWILAFHYGAENIGRYYNADGLTDSQAKAIADLVIGYNAVNAWFQDFKNNKTQLLYQKVLADIFSRTDKNSLTLQTLNADFKVLGEAFPEQIDNIVEQVCSEANAESVQQLDIDQLNMDLLARIAENLPIKDQILAKIDNDILNIKDSAWWSDALKGGHNWQLIQKRAGALKGKIPATHLADPLSEFIKDLLSKKNINANEDTPDLISDDRDFFTILDKGGQKTVINTVSDHIKQNSFAIESFIILMDIFEGIYQKINLTAMPHEAADKILFPLIRSDVDKAITYIEARKSDWQKIVTALPEDGREQLHSALAGLPEESQTKIYRLLNINKPAPPAVEQETETQPAEDTKT